MISSMTGFARKDISFPAYTIKMELKSLNHKFLEINTYFSKELTFLEPEARKCLSKNFYRGKIDGYASLKINDSNFLIPKLNSELLNEIIDNLNELDLSFNKNYVIDIAHLLMLPGVYSLSIDETKLKESIEPEFIRNWNQLIMELKAYRESEGGILYHSIISILDNCDEKVLILTSFIEKNRYIIEQNIKEKIKELKFEDQLEINRFYEEMLYYIIKMDITEEVTRLKAHLQRFRQLLDSNNQVGRELDFIIQEMNREVQTILSKSSFQEITDNLIELKINMEKIRQQIQNIE